MKRLIVALALIFTGLLIPANAQQNNPGMTWEQFVRFLLPRPPTPAVPQFVGPAWIWEMVQPLPVSLPAKVAIAYQIWIQYLLAGGN